MNTLPTLQIEVEPDGFKAQVVCYDRECCLLYKEELDKLLGADAVTIVMDTNNDKEDRYKAYLAIAMPKKAP